MILVNGTAGLECVHVYFASLMVLNCASRISQDQDNFVLFYTARSST